MFIFIVRVIVGILVMLLLKNRVLVIMVFFVKDLIRVFEINDELGLLNVI